MKSSSKGSVEVESGRGLTPPADIPESHRSQTLTSQDLDALEALEKAATGGEWSWEEHGNGWALYSGRNEKINGFSVHGLNLLNATESDAFDWNGANNRALIAAACNALPALLAAAREAERLRAENAMLRVIVDDAQTHAMAEVVRAEDAGAEEVKKK